MFSCFGSKKPVQKHSKFKKPYYCLKSFKTGKVICVDPDPANKNQAVIWDENKQDNQRFVIKQKGPDSCLKCKKDKLYLTVDGPQNGSRVYCTTKPLGQRQRFRTEEVSTDPKTGAKRYVIYTFFGKVLDVFEGQTENGTKLVQYDYTGRENQIWQFCDPTDQQTESDSQNGK